MSSPTERPPAGRARDDRPPAGRAPDDRPPAERPPVPVAVVLGGPSAEHDVSIVSGAAIAEALADAGHPVSEHLVDLDGRWWTLPDGHHRTGRPQSAYDDPAALGARGPLLAGEALAALAAADPGPVVFVALHGPFGEDGTIQALLEADGLAYTGSGVAASAVGMDKAFFKRVARGVGIPVLPWLEVGAARWAADPDGALAEVEDFARAAPGGRVIVKPSRLGSSVGMSIAWTPADRAPALELAFRFDSRVMVEPCLPTPRELEVAVIGSDPAALEIHGPGEVIPSRDFYDYIDKYVAGAAVTHARADLTDEVAERCRRIAGEAFAAIGGEGFARVDFLLDRRTGELWCNEINTIPGFTPISLFPKMAAAGGLDFRALCERIVDLAVARHASAPRRRLAPADMPR
jgi:D-alanine-D-alanine ligase